MGIVKFINLSNGLCAIELGGNNFSIFEDFNEGLSIGDIVRENLESMGGVTLHKATTEVEVDGTIENYGYSLSQIGNQLKMQQAHE